MPKTNAAAADALFEQGKKILAQPAPPQPKTANNVVSGETADLPEFLKSHPVAAHLPPVQRQPPMTELELEFLEYLNDETTDKGLLLRAMRACTVGSCLDAFLSSYENWTGCDSPEEEFIRHVLMLYTIGFLSPSRILQDLPQFVESQRLAENDVRQYLKTHPQLVAELALEVTPNA